MGRPRLHHHSVRKALLTIAVLGTSIFATTATASAMGPWQNSRGDYDKPHQWHDAGWWLQNSHDWVTINDPEWTERYSETVGQIGDSDRLHAWHSGTGSFDRSTSGDLPPAARLRVTSIEGTSAKNAEAVHNFYRFEETL